MPDSTGRLIVVSGPSGVGKGTVLARVFQESPLPLEFSVSATTRPPRHGERDGVHYHFLTRDEFAARRQRGDFLEAFEVYAGGDWYGTYVHTVDAAIARGAWIVLEIDVQGGMKVKEVRPNAVTIFVAPPSLESLAERLRARGSESEESLQRRLAHAAHEIEHAKHYDACIVNDGLETAVTHILTLLEKLQRD